MSETGMQPGAKTNSHVFMLAGEAVGAPGLSSSRCLTCRRYTLGRVPVCQHCFSRDLAIEAAGQKAELVEFSVAHVPAGGFEAPYVIGLVRTDEDLTLFAPLIGETAGLGKGRRLRFVTVERDDGRIGFAYRAEADGDAAR